MNKELVKQKLATFGQRALSTPKTLRSSFDLAERCILHRVEGDFVECGVFNGSQVAAMALANQIYNGGKRIHLFDSFVGIPQAGPNDDETITSCIGEGDGKGALVTTGVSACSAEAVQSHMQQWGIDSGQLVYHIGWFQDTVPVAVNKEKSVWKIALLRLDGDLYESTKVCLEYLHPLVVEGGIVIIDDFALTGCRKACEEYWASIGLAPEISYIERGEGVMFYKL